MQIRPARPSDLRHLAAVEGSGSELFEAWWPGVAERVPALLAAPPTGAERDQVPGWLLVAAEDAEVVGFAHVTAYAEQEDVAHLEQLSVLPAHGRRGIGSALVAAALEEARWADHDAMSLCTYRDVPWNAPFYAGLGFAVAERPTAFQRRLRLHEQELGLDGAGPRVVMSRPLVRR